jgi:hypothetical protein
MREREERGGGDTHRRRSLQIHAAAGVLAPVLAPHEEEKQERERHDDDVGKEGYGSRMAGRDR